MMTDGIKEFSKEEATSLIYYGPPTSVAPVQQAAPAAPIAAPAAPSAAPSTSPRLTPPRAGKPSASIPDPNALVEQVLDANRRLKEQTPAPQPPSAISGLVDQVTSNWMPLAVGAGAVYALTRGPSDVKRTYEAGKRLMTRSAPLDESTKIDPTFASDHEMRQAELDAQKPKPTLTPFENLQQRAADLTASVQGKPMPAPGMAPQPIAPTLPGAVGNAPAGIPSVQQPFTAAPQPMVGAAVATGGNVNQAIQQTVAQEIDKPVAPVVDTPKTPQQLLATATDAELGLAMKEIGSPVSMLPPATIQAEIDQRKAAAAPAPAPAPAPTKAKGKPVAPPAAPVELRTGSGFPAFAGTGEAVGDVKNWRAPKGGNIDFAKLPSDLVFVPNMGPGLNTARQTLGQEGAQLLAQQLGAPWGADAETRQRLAEFNENRVGPPLTRDQRKAVKAPPLPNTSGINMKTGLKGLGAAGVVMSIADVAKAESAQQRQEAIGNALLGLLSPTMAVNQAGAPGVAMSEDVYKLGSPYYQSEEAKRYRQGQKVGAGRGIAPPSAYQR